jgi:cell division transport system permease protein
MKLSPRYFLAEAIISLRRNIMMGIAAISTVAISLFVVGLFVFMAYDFRAVVNAVERQVEISVYLKDTVTPEVKDEMQQEIESWDDVRSVTYMSKDEALQKFVDMVGENSEIVREIQGNPFPASFEISLNNPRDVEDVAGRFMESEGSYVEGVDEVVYGKQYVGKLFSITTILGLIIGLVVILLLFSAVILIYNTIRLAIYSRRKEVEVMKLVGASNWFVTWPFIFEGIIQGVLGGLVAVFLIWLTNQFVLVKAEQAIINTLHIWNLAVLGENPVQATVLLSIIIMGILIGAGGSAVALRRFLRV